jgi:hypothetical protein
MVLGRDQSPQSLSLGFALSLSLDIFLCFLSDRFSLNLSCSFLLADTFSVRVLLVELARSLFLYRVNAQSPAHAGKLN